jgi:hypothetical protein
VVLPPLSGAAARDLIPTARPCRVALSLVSAERRPKSMTSASAFQELSPMVVEKLHLPADLTGVTVTVCGQLSYCYEPLSSTRVRALRTSRITRL